VVVTSGVLWPAPRSSDSNLKVMRTILSYFVCPQKVGGKCKEICHTWIVWARITALKTKMTCGENPDVQ